MRDVKRSGQLTQFFSGCFLGLIFWSLISFLGMEVESLSLASHFQVFQTAAWSFLLVVYSVCSWQSWTRKVGNIKLWAGSASLCLHCAVLALCWLPSERPSFESYEVVEVVWFNMGFEKEAITQLESLVKDSPPDILVICEIGNDIEISLPSLQYRHRSLRTNTVIASRLHLGDQLVRVGSGGARHIFGTRVQVGSTDFFLMALHFRQPFYRDHYKEFSQLEDWVTTVPHAIVVGDFNSTIWGAPLRHLLRSGDLKHAREGFGILSSWAPHRFRWFPLPIDHMLYRGKIELVSFEILPWTSSDHRPLRGIFHIKGKPVRL